MHRMTRYVLLELAKVFSVALVGLTTAILLVGVVREAVSQGLPPAEVLKIIPYILPDALRFAIPVTLLLAVTTVYSRMSGFNEIVALKASGISPLVVIWPAFVVAVLLSLVTVWLNDIAPTWGRAGVRGVVIESVEDIIYGMLRVERRFTGRRLAINVKAVSDRTLIRPTVSIARRGSTPPITVTAESARLETDHRERVLRLEFLNGTIDVEGRATFSFLGTRTVELPLSDASGSDEATPSPSAIPLRQIPEEAAEQERAIARLQEAAAAEAACRLFTGDFGELASDTWKRNEIVLRDMHGRLFRLRLEPYRRWSTGFSCLFFVWVGVPMAVWLRKPEPLTSFFLCFAPILVVYYPLLIYGINGAKNGTIPPVLVWTGNVVLFAWGAWALRKVLRH
ncbi:MAG: LptF/LptG family permease [Thermoguttaceae bacterium]|nr:LptF/LptG family permease [Thermoguttaceae bacterium]